MVKKKKVAKKATKKVEKSQKEVNFKDYLNSPYLFLGVVVLILLVIVGFAYFNQSKSLPPTNNPSDLNANDKITLTYYLDFQCPYCSLFSEQYLKPVLEKYKDKINLDVRVLAFLDHGSDKKDSIKSARAYYCAEEQGLGKEMFQLLEHKAFEHYSAGGKENVGFFSEDNLKDFAKEISNLNQDTFAECIASTRYDEKITKANNDFFQNGGRGTPTVMLNNKTINWQKLEDEVKKLLGTYKKQKITLYAIYPDDCTLCSMSVDQLNKALSQELDVNLITLKPTDNVAKGFSAKYDIKVYPAYFVSTDENIPLLKSLFKELESNFYGVYDIVTYYPLYMGSNGAMFPQYFKDLPDFNVNGLGNGKLKIIEFSDYMCPYCEKFHKDNFESLKKDYIDTNKITFIYLQKPIEQLHPGTEKVSEAALCARDQNAFWDYHYKLFENNAKMYEELSTYTKDQRTEDSIRALMTKYFGKEVLINLASDLNLDVNTFRDCLDNNLHTLEVETDSKLAESFLIGGTPSFLVGNELVPGYMAYDNFRKIIDAKLK